MIVKVYFNLHKKKFSVVHKNKVIGHSEWIALKNCEFIVQPAGRRKVLETRVKNVHAYVKGELTEEAIFEEGSRVISYNPYVYGFFYDIETHELIGNAELAVLTVNENKPSIRIKPS